MVYLVPFLAVAAGCALAFYIRPKNRQNLKLLLAFSGSFLLSLTILHLLPGAFEASPAQPSYLGLFIMAGIVLQLLLEYFSKGAEHGHVHAHLPARTPALLFVSLCLHALLEGFPLHQNPELAWGIGVHHFPIAIILTLFLQHAKLRPAVVAAYLLSFALMTPLGAALSQEIAFVTQHQPEMAALVAGMLFHISSTIIFESSEAHQFNGKKLLGILAGFVAGYLL